jgi:hypothetical protein
MNDIKQVLATAFEAEPPVRIDRTQLIKKGRRRLLGRWMATAGATVLAAAVVVGTTMIVGLGQPEELQPGSPGLTPPRPPTTSSPSRSPLVPDASPQLTKALAESRILPAGLALRAIPGSGNALQFQRDRNRFEASADVVDNQGNEGTLFVMVADSTENNARPTCAAPNTCVQREFGGRSVQLTTAPLGSEGEVLLMAHTRLADGVQVYAMTSNVAVKAVEQHGKAASPPTTPTHLLTLDQLGQIVGLAELKL